MLGKLGNRGGPTGITVGPKGLLRLQLVWAEVFFNIFPLVYLFSFRSPSLGDGPI